MAQRKSPPAGKSGASRAPASAKSTKPPAGGRPGGARPPAKKGKSIVNQKQTPWGMIISTVLVVLFAVAVVVVVIVTNKSDDGSSTSTGGQAVDKNDPYRQPALAAAMKIKGVTYRVEGKHDHVGGTVKYDASPPIGGNHSQLWANCNGNVYDHQIANENAVHMLEHGAVWITYNPKTIKSGDLAKLTSEVKGQDRLALSPYAGLKTPISLQAWGYQLFLSDASDARIAQFIATLKYNPKTTPEQASCSDPYFDAKKSKPGHPQES
jgi:Protein of unknown function (DUF3105)